MLEPQQAAMVADALDDLARACAALVATLEELMSGICATCGRTTRMDPDTGYLDPYCSRDCRDEADDRAAWADEDMAAATLADEAYDRERGGDDDRDE